MLVALGGLQEVLLAPQLQRKMAPGQAQGVAQPDFQGKNFKALKFLSPGGRGDTGTGVSSPRDALSFHPDV